MYDMLGRTQLFSLDVFDVKSKINFLTVNKYIAAVNVNSRRQL